MKSNQEIWTPVAEYEDLYIVSNMGRLARKFKSGYKLLHPSDNQRGYQKVTLSRGGVLRTFSVHRLVALHFLPNPLSLPEVNHINEDKMDNRACNLEWCDRSYNVNFGTRTEKQKTKVSRPVVQITLIGFPVAVYESGIQAERETNICSQSICACCRGKRKTAGGYRWLYEEDWGYE